MAGTRCPITRAAHKKEPCHAAYIGRDGAAVFVCTEPQRHAAGTADGGRARPRRQGGTRREAGGEQGTAAGERRPDRGGDGAADRGRGPLDAVSGTSWVRSSTTLPGDPPRRRAAARPRRARRADVGGERTRRAALRAHAETGTEAALRVAVAIHWALAEKDAGAEHEAWRGGPGVIAYTEVLVANGYTETAGDAANRDRYGYGARRAFGLTPDDEDDPADVTAEPGDGATE